MQKISLAIVFLLFSHLFLKAQDVNLFEKQWLIQKRTAEPFT